MVNLSTARFLQREIIFFRGYSNFLCGGPKVPLPASQPVEGWDSSSSGGDTGIHTGRIRVAEEDEAMKNGPWVARKRKAFWEARFAVAVANCNASMIT
jgi:hypothetical protein